MDLTINFSGAFKMSMNLQCKCVESSGHYGDAVSFPDSQSLSSLSP